jgi:uncharacterized protein YutE (UPF0331/DUF86 family)
MVDRERVLSKIAELRGYLEKLKEITPKTLEEYERSELERRACERLLQISIECVLDVCDIIFSGLKLGVPVSEEDIIEKLNHARVITDTATRMLNGMRGTRNILVHRYPYVDDEKIFRSLTTELKDFDIFMDEILNFLKKKKKLVKIK